MSGEVKAARERATRVLNGESAKEVYSKYHPKHCHLGDLVLLAKSFLAQPNDAAKDYESTIETLTAALQMAREVIATQLRQPKLLAEIDAALAMKGSV